MWNQIQREPVLFQGLIQAGLSLAVAFGTNLDAEVIGALVAFSAAVLSFLTRTQVTPMTSLQPAGSTPIAPAAGMTA